METNHILNIIFAGIAIALINASLNRERLDLIMDHFDNWIKRQKAEDFPLHFITIVMWGGSFVCLYYTYLCIKIGYDYYAVEGAIKIALLEALRIFITALLLFSYPFLFRKIDKLMLFASSFLESIKKRKEPL